MFINSQKSIQIENYVQGHPEALMGKWQMELSGQKSRLDFYRLPIHLLRYNTNNGRFKMEVREWEDEEKRELDSTSPDDSKLIRSMLMSLDPTKTSDLKSDLQLKGQLEPGIITHDGVVINGNRRMAVLEILHEEEPTGKWQYLEAILLPPGVSERDLWKIEAGLHLSKEKIAEYHPVNDLLKIKEGITAGLSSEEVAAAMYGRTVQEVNEGLQRLDIIEQFLEYFSQPLNYGLIKKFGLHEYFVNIQKSVLKMFERHGIKKRERAKLLQNTFALIKAHVLIKSRSVAKQKGLTHFAVRQLAKILEDPRARETYLENLSASQKDEVSPETIIEGFETAKEVLDNQEQRDQPVRLIQRAVKALESIDTNSEYFRNPQTRNALRRLNEIVLRMYKDVEQGA